MTFLVLYATALLVLLPTRWTMAATVGRVHGWLWALPMTLLGVLRLVVYWPMAIRWVDGVIEVDCKRLIPGWATGQTIGMLTCYAPGLLTAPSPGRLRRHEHRHAWGQFAVYGPLMLFLYPLALLSVAVQGGNWYRDSYFEVDARGHEVDP